MYLAYYLDSDFGSFGLLDEDFKTVGFNIVFNVDLGLSKLYHSYLLDLVPMDVEQQKLNSVVDN